MAHEHSVGIDLDGGLLLESNSHEIVQPAEGKGDVASSHTERGSRLGIGADQREVLEIRSVISGGLQTVQRKLGGDVFASKIAAARADSAAFEQIAGQKFHVRAYALAGDVGGP